MLCFDLHRIPHFGKSALTNHLIKSNDFAYAFLRPLDESMIDYIVKGIVCQTFFQCFLKKL